MKTMDLTQLNSPLMWLGCGLPVLFLLFLAGRTWKKSYKTGQEIGLEQSQLKAAIKTSAITAIGPSIACLAGMFAVMAIMGGPVAFMRLSFVGNSMFELMAAGFGAGATGIQVGVDKMTENGFMAALLVRMPSTPICFNSACTSWGLVGNSSVSPTSSPSLYLPRLVM